MERVECPSRMFDDERPDETTVDAKIQMELKTRYSPALCVDRCIYTLSLFFKRNIYYIILFHLVSLRTFCDH